MGLSLRMDMSLRGGLGGASAIAHPDTAPAGLRYLGARFMRSASMKVLRIAATLALILIAGSSWDGTVNSGGAAPALDTSLQGSGFAQSAMGAANVPQNLWIGNDGLNNDETEVTIIVNHGDQSFIKQVAFYLEGSTAIVSIPKKNLAKGTWGYGIRPQGKAGVGGEATLTFDVIPYNGYVYRGSVTLTLNTDGTLTRPVRYVSTGGNDGTGDGLTRGTAWATVEKAISACTDGAAKGAIVKLGAGTYTLSDNTKTQNANTRMVTIVSDDGLTASDVTIKWASRTTNSNGRGAGVWQPKAVLLQFQRLTYDTSTTCVLWGAQAATTRITFKDCKIIDSNGVAGPVDSRAAWTNGGALGAIAPLSGIGYGESAVNSFFKDTEGQQYSFLECQVQTYLWASPKLARGCYGSVSADFGFFAATANGGVFSGSYSTFVDLNFTIDTPFPTRRHIDAELVLASAVFDGTNTTLTWSNAAPALHTISSGQGGGAMKFLTGANVGQAGTGGEDAWYGGYHVVSQNSTQTVVTGDCSTATGGAQVGDTARVFLIFHCDTFQFNRGTAAGPNFYNIMMQNVRAGGVALGNMGLLQPGDFALSGTVSATAGNTSFTTSATEVLQPDDMLIAGGGAEYARIVSYNAGAKTGVLAGTGFANTYSGATMRQVKTANNLSMVNVVCYTDAAYTVGPQWQWQNGGRNVVVRQCSIIGGLTPAVGAGGTWIFTGAGFAVEDFRAYDNIFEKMSSTGNPFPPSAAYTIDNNYFRQGTVRGTNSTAGASVSVTFSSEFKPTFTGGSPAISGAAKIPVYADNSVRASNSPLGAMPAA